MSFLFGVLDLKKKNNWIIWLRRWVELRLDLVRFNPLIPGGNEKIMYT